MQPPCCISIACCGSTTLMGHERVGSLPKSQRWRAIVGQIASSSSTEFDISALAGQTLQNVRSRFRNIQQDEGTQAAFTFLVQIAVSSRAPDDHQFVDL